MYGKDILWVPLKFHTKYFDLTLKDTMFTCCWRFTSGGRVMHICFGIIIIIGSDDGLSPGQRQAIIWLNAWIMLIGTLGVNRSEIIITINAFSFKKMHLKLSSAKWRLFRPGLNGIFVVHCYRASLTISTSTSVKTKRPWDHPERLCR